MEPPAARLEVVSGKGAGMSVLVVDELLIGRHAEGAGRLAEDDEISRTHARVTVDSDGRCVIEDLGSTNGTFVNGRRISEPQSLAIGDKLELGATVLLVKDLPAPPAQFTQLRVEPTVINAPLPTALPGGQQAPVDPDATRVDPTAIPAPAEPIVPDTAASPAPTQPPSDAPTFEPTAVPAPAEPDTPTVEPTAVPAPAEPPVPDTAATPLPTQPPPAAPPVEPTAIAPPAEPLARPAEPTAIAPPAEPLAPPAEPTAVPPPAEPDAPPVEATAIVPPAEPDAPPSPAPLVAPPSPLRLEVDFEAGEVRIATGHDSEPIRLVFEDGSWRPASG
jgi:pilus assembly protein CpaF